MRRRTGFFAGLALLGLLLILSACQVSTDGAVGDLQPSPTLFPGLQSLPGSGESKPSAKGENSSDLVSNSEGRESGLDDPEIVEFINQGGIFIRVNADQASYPLSPLIYGLSGGDSAYWDALKPALLSWGGNPSSRYNWKLGNAWNAGSDWYYQNGNYGVPDGVSASELFIQEAQEIESETRLAVPTLGWVAKDRQSCSFPNADGTCGDAGGANCEAPGAIADPLKANLASDPASIVEWIAQLKAAGLMPRIIAMDNEPELWGYTHYDVHPECTTYEEVLEKYLAYATALRDNFPGVELGGPVACCWFSYWNLAPGPQVRGSNIPEDYIAWFLQSVREYDEGVGQRHLDVLDVHFYPQGEIFNSNVDEDTAARRLRSTRALWDPAYIDESWINQPIFFIPRMRALIERYYPGTKLGISEWNWGADETMNGALAIADVLGIMGREGVHYAAYWRNPPLNSPGFFAFKLFSNFDDLGSRFSGKSISSESSDWERLSSYAAYDEGTGRLLVMLVHKQGDQAAEVRLEWPGYQTPAEADIYRYSSADLAGIQKSSMAFDATGTPYHSISLPPNSISLLVLEQK